MGLFLLVRMGLVHMWAFYLKPNGFDKIRKHHLGPLCTWWAEIGLLKSKVLFYFFI